MRQIFGTVKVLVSICLIFRYIYSIQIFVKTLVILLYLIKLLGVF
jgi:hypothetical protein